MTTCNECSIQQNLRDDTPFTADETGCYADGIFGSFHVDAKAVRLAHQFGMELDDEGHLLLLDADMNNGREIGDHGMSEVWGDYVRLSIDYLNDHAVEEGLLFEFHDGDLFLSRIEDSDYL
jgi:hypothetical protein